MAERPLHIFKDIHWTPHEFGPTHWVETHAGEVTVLRRPFTSLPYSDLYRHSFPKKPGEPWAGSRVGRWRREHFSRVPMFQTLNLSTWQNKKTNKKRSTGWSPTVSWVRKTTNSADSNYILSQCIWLKKTDRQTDRRMKHFLGVFDGHIPSRNRCHLDISL